MSHFRSSRRVFASVAIATCILAVPANAKTFEVTRKNDPNPGPCKPNDCSLREAIRAANAKPGADKVVLPTKGTYNLSRASTLEDGALDGDLDIANDPLQVIHTGEGRATVDANGTGRVFSIFAGARTTIKRLVITGGDGREDTPPPPPTRGMGFASEGGGILSFANLKVIASKIVKNRSASHGGGIGLVSDAGATIVRTTIARNTAGGDGGGIDGDDGRLVIKRSRITNNTTPGSGGAIYFFSRSEKPSLISRTTIAGNRANDSGGISMTGNNAPPRGPGLVPSVLRIEGSTIANNRATSGGGGGIHVQGELRVVNSTISGNRATGSGGGIENGTGKATLNAVTVVRNVANTDQSGFEPGGGLFYGALAPGMDVGNSIIALNKLGDGTKNDCGGGDDFDSKGGNLLSTLGPMNACVGFDKPSDLVRSNPKLGQLAKNGGPTKTVALKQGSPAIGKARKSTAPGKDQRGRKRDDDPDIGSFER